MKRVAIIGLVVGLLLVALHGLNPPKAEFNHFIWAQVKDQVEHEIGTKGSILGQVLTRGLEEALIDQMSTRTNYYFFSLYTLDLPGEPSRHFLGILHIFFPV